MPAGKPLHRQPAGQEQHQALQCTQGEASACCSIPDAGCRICMATMQVPQIHALRWRCAAHCVPIHCTAVGLHCNTQCLACKVAKPPADRRYQSAVRSNRITTLKQAALVLLGKHCCCRFLRVVHSGTAIPCSRIILFLQTSRPRLLPGGCTKR